MDTAARDHTESHSCHLRIGNCTKIGQEQTGDTYSWSDESRCCCDIKMEWLEFGVNNRKAWIHPASD